MSFKWYGKVINKFKNLGTKIEVIESNVFSERQKFKDILERNLVLEKEISDRTNDLNQANQSLLTMKHIWSTMNSAEPLSAVLSTITNSLSEELGYIYCFIVQMQPDNNPNNNLVNLKIRAETENLFGSKIQDTLHEYINSSHILLNNCNNIMYKSVLTREIRSIKSFKHLFSGISPVIQSDKLEKLDTLLGNRSISILPITSQDEPFGCLVVVSIRSDISDIEKNFLSLFAGQIELAVTITGLFEQIREQAITDGLTGLYNRRYFDQNLASEVDRALRLKQPFTLITLDLDHLKQINDTYGHSAGDTAIRNIGTILKQNARSIDIPARFGGEEFAIILPGVDLEGGLIAAERLRLSIEKDNIPAVGTITASIGVVTFLRHTESLGELLELADQAMYCAKRNGRNQVQIAIVDDSAIDWQKLALNAFTEILTKQRIPVPKVISSDLVSKLKTPNLKDKDINDFLYFIVDSLGKTYNPQLMSGLIKDKLAIAIEMAKAIKLCESEVDKLKLAILLYDIGNLMMPESIMLKPGPLNNDEMKQIEQHPIIAAREMLKPIMNLNSIIPIIEHHHEQWDGKGYPASLTGENIPVGSRIICIIDAYFAMVADRPYRKALSHDEAVKLLKKGANKEWDGKLVDIFINIIEKQKKKTLN